MYNIFKVESKTRMWYRKREKNFSCAFHTSIRPGAKNDSTDQNNNNNKNYIIGLIEIQFYIVNWYNLMSMVLRGNETARRCTCGPLKPIFFLNGNSLRVTTHAKYRPMKKKWKLKPLFLLYCSRGWSVIDIPAPYKVKGFSAARSLHDYRPVGAGVAISPPRLPAAVRCSPARPGTCCLRYSAGHVGRRSRRGWAMRWGHYRATWHVRVAVGMEVWSTLVAMERELGTRWHVSKRVSGSWWARVWMGENGGVGD